MSKPRQKYGSGDKHNILLVLDAERGQRLQRISETTGVSRPRLLAMLLDQYIDTIEVRIGGKPLNKIQTASAVTAA